jgi:putative acetyltransferase
MIMQKEYTIKEAETHNFEEIMAINKTAFGSEIEAGLVADLLKDNTAKPRLSLLAFHKNKEIGHILFTRVYIDKMKSNPICHILAPMAVLLEYQKQGIGGLLIKAGLEKLKAIGSQLVFVLGHITFYPKYGFVTEAKKQGFPAPYTIPDEHADAWMVQALTPDALEINHGQIRCANQLNKPELWAE